MAHAGPPSPKGFGEAGPSPGHAGGAAAHTSADDEYLVTPPGSGHEHTDTNVWVIVKFGLWLAISAIVIHLGLGLLFGVFVKRSEETVREFPLASQEHRLPASPRLQQFPENEFHDFRLREQAVLEQYGWVNKDTGVVRMPIADAMRLAVERGLPVRAASASAEASASAKATADKTADKQEAPQQTQTPGLMPADSSAGRTMERRRQ
jgi:hypothetical protein